MRSRLFITLTLTTALLTIGLIVFGAVVRVTDSGLGCGNQWPLCNGTLIPPLDNLTAWIEWLHRLFAVLIGLFGLATLFVAIRAYRRQNMRVLGATVIAAVLFAFQSILGALVVVLDLPPTAVTLHLGTAMLLLGALLVAGVIAGYKPKQHYTRSSATMLAYIAAALAFVVILSGALVRGSGATLACTDWPLCNGEVLPFSQGPLATIHFLHRLIVIGLGVTLVMLVYTAWRARIDRRVRNLAALAGVAYLAQAGVGALFVLSAAAPLWGAVHVGMAATTWALLVVVSTYESLNTGSESRQQIGWQPQSEALRG
ncbi:MAG: COX15/CtaA family protein [Chloroflexi bacterium]|nr:COX15/CtaA family protein [Chloroflexota bacterium]